ncbi:MAG: methyltransferase domain-containing protein [Myxococcales bacterium]|jgi:predicted methyltransferase
MPARRSLALLLTLLALGCASTPSPTRAPTAAGTRSKSRPPSEASVRPGVNDKYFEPGATETWSDVFEGESREVSRHRDAIVSRLDLRPGQVVGDVGAGTGLFSVPLARAVGPGGRVYAVDIVPAFLENIAQRTRAAGQSNVQTVLGEEWTTGLPPGSLDLAFLCNVYHHLEYPISYMRSVADALAPGGRLVVIDFERVPGVTSPRMLRHVRAGKQTVIDEITRAGFRLQRQERFLKENYFLVFAPN